MSTETEDDALIEGGGAARSPGLLLVFEGGKPTLRAVPFGDCALRVGRGASCAIAVVDTRASSAHAEVSLTENGVRVRDLASRNGTYVDGAKIADVVAPAPRVIRMGATVLAVVADVAPWVKRSVIVHEELVIGPSTHRARVAIADAARRRKTCLITGESGTGKESAARHYHASGPHASGPFQVVNCAAIPRELAETELFGAAKGAHSTALADKLGTFVAAHGGVLFLDEIGTLDLALQAKLLRAVETKEITPVGGTTARRVDVDICSATNADLDAEVERGAFRMDLLQRIRQAEVTLPPLRERPDELGYLVETIVKRADGAAIVAASLVEACLLRSFRGTNVRGLTSAVDAAVVRARAEGRVAVLDVDLPKPKPSDAWNQPAMPLEPAALLSDRQRRAQAFLEAYRRSGDVESAARSAGISRSTAYAILKRSKR